jgi:hypothetical protein
MNVVAPMAVAIDERRVDPLDCFVARAEARAYLWVVGEYELQLTSYSTTPNATA